MKNEIRLIGTVKGGEIMINYETVIPELLREKFDIGQLREPMYHSDSPYGLMPHVLFF